MLRFVLPNPGQWTPRHAHLIGPDDLALPGEITLSGNTIEAVKRVEGAGALAIQYPLPAPTGGVLSLRTTLLPERPAPYLLTLELARYQVMLLLNKLEEWALFDLPASDPVMLKVEQARSAWTHALVAQRRSGAIGVYSAEAQSAATDALIVAIEAGEALALMAARTQHSKRTNGELEKLARKPAPANAITDHEANEALKRASGSAGVILPELPLVGVGVSPAVFAPAVCEAVLKCADFVSVPMRWSELEPTEGKYNFSRIDRWIEWAVTKAKLPVTAGPVLDFDAGGVPDFLYIWEHDYETLRDVVVEHVKQVVTRYRRTVQTWTICSGLHVGSTFAISYEEAVDLTRLCVLIVKKLHPQAKVQIEIAQPWGEYTAEAGARAARSIPPTVYGELLNQVGLEYDALALKVQMGVPLPGRSTRDLIALSAMLDRFGRLDKPIALSVVGAPSAPVTAQGDDALEPGVWRKPWSPEQQGAWASKVLAVAAGKPYVRSLCWQEAADAPAPSMAGGGLLNALAQPRPAMSVLCSMRESLRGKAARLPGCE